MVVNSNLMNELELYGFGADIDALESYVANLQDAAGLGNPVVDDSQYDAYIRLLRQLKPTSSVLNRNWEVDDNELTEYDGILKQYGMCSITTLTSLSELSKFGQVLKEIGHPIDLFASVKENGHGVRAVYLNGKLHSGSTRGRYKKGRDITRHLKAVLPNVVPQWKDIEVVEVRGEMLVSIENFEKHLREKLKTPLSSVTSLIRDSVSDEELKYLDMVCYKVIPSDCLFGSLKEEFDHLKSCGFNVPQDAMAFGISHLNIENAVKRILGYFEGLMDKGEIKYACDGIVFAINDNETFYSAGKSGNAWNGNFALKMGRYWESNIYSAKIEEIKFIPGKSYLTPKAVIEPVKTVTGAEVSTVPLYNIGVMERYHYLPGETIYFRFGGETGVTLCDVEGRSVKA